MTESTTPNNNQNDDEGEKIRPLYHDPKEDETADEYAVIIRIVRNQSGRKNTIEETFDVAAVSESMAGEEAKHLAKEKYGHFDRVLEVIKQ